MAEIIDILHPITGRMRMGLYSLLDRIDQTVMGQKWKRVPPRTVSLRSPSDYRRAGARYKRYIVEYGWLLPEHDVLDVGCGAGRIARQLTGYLKRRSKYRGFDVSEEGIKWCRKCIGKKNKNFKFKAVKLYNGQYAPEGATRAEDFRFQYKDESFDFVILTSVFTHMLPKEVENYMREMSRVLRPGGRCFLTMFLLNPESRQLIERGKSHEKLKFAYQEMCRVRSRQYPEFAIGYDEDYFRKLLIDNNLVIKHSPRYGSWCGRRLHLAYQDIVMAQKARPGDVR